MAEADAEHRQSAVADRRGADAEVARAFRAGRARARRRRSNPERAAPAHDAVVVAHHERRLAVHLAEQLEEVVRERVVVVDQQRLHRGGLAGGAPAAHEMTHRAAGPATCGVSSTTLVVDGTPVALEPHPGRAAASVGALHDRSCRRQAAVQARVAGAQGIALDGCGSRVDAERKAPGACLEAVKRRRWSDRAATGARARSTCARRRSTAGTARTSRSTAPR